jgi:CRISPR-associated endonuclease Csn1
MSVIHDSGVSSADAKVGDSRKMVSGVARRARRLRKQYRRRLRALDTTLLKLGYPLTKLEIQDTYKPWLARLELQNEYIQDDEKRKVLISIAIRHIARHRGWRNAYQPVSSLYNLSKEPSKYYKEFAAKLGADIEGNRLSVSMLVKDYLNNNFQLRSEKTCSSDDKENELNTHIGKLHQSDNLYEILKIFETQKVSLEHQNKLITGDIKQNVTRNGHSWVNTLGGVFSSVNPRDVGAAADLVGHDELPGQEKFFRATKASIAFQKYRIVSIIMNIRVGDKHAWWENNRLLPDEIQTILYGNEEQKGLFNLDPKDQELITWDYVAELLNIDRKLLKGVGRAIMKYNRETEKWEASDDVVSAKRPPVITTEGKLLDNEIAKLPKPLLDWYTNLNDTEVDEIKKERFIESVGNAGRTKPMNEIEQNIDREIDSIVAENLDEKELGDLEKIGGSLSAGRAAYSVDSLRKLTETMLKYNCDLHEARARCFFGFEFDENDEISDSALQGLLQNNNWKPTPAAIDEQTGSPSVDRTLQIIARWLKACERNWGKPATVNIEHIREGFSSLKTQRDVQNEMDRNYKKNLEIFENIKGDYQGSSESVRKADLRRAAAIERQVGKCAYCGSGISFTTSQMDHIVPRQGIGSTNTNENLVATCENCNRKKSSTLFSSWVNSQTFKLDEIVTRINKEWINNMKLSAKNWNKYKKAVVTRLKATVEDEPIDNRSIESVAWMARELRERIEGRYSYKQSDLQNDSIKQRVFVFRGSVTAAARKVGRIERNLHWIGGSSAKTRLDRRHHAVDASVIALVAPGAAQVLNQQAILRTKQFEHRGLDGDGISTKEEFKREVSEGRYFPSQGEVFWKEFRGIDTLTDDPIEQQTNSHTTFEQWLDNMRSNNPGDTTLLKLLNKGFDNGSILVTRQLRLKLGNGSVHDDTVGKMKIKKVGDSFTYDDVNRASTKELYFALIDHPDYIEPNPWKTKDTDIVLEQDNTRTLTVEGRLLSSDDVIKIMKGSLSMDGSPLPVRKGYVAQGSAIHHARVYKIPKLNSKGDETGFTYAMLRVFTSDLTKCKTDLFTYELPIESYSRRYANPNLKYALNENLAEFIGYLTINDEIEVSPEQFNTNAISSFLKTFNESIEKNGERYNIEVNKFIVAGYNSNTDIKLKPAYMASEGLEKLPQVNELPKDKNGNLDSDKIARIRENYSKLYNLTNDDWENIKTLTLREDVKKNINNVNTVFGDIQGLNGSWHPGIDGLLKSGIKVLRRNTLGEERWNKPLNGNLPISWETQQE